MKSQQGQGGFSLVEVSVGVGLLAIVSGIATPVASQYLERYRFIGATNQLAFEISRARMQAVGQNVFMRIRLDGPYYLRERSLDGVRFVPDGMVTALPKGIEAYVGQTGAPSFNRNGVAVVATEITLHGDHIQKTIRTNILGRVTVLAHAGEGWPSY